MALKLRDLIRQVRACKTAAEERAVIAKESAMIRTAIKEEQVQFRHRNVAKLLYMHVLGYPTHFGQLECMKLIASPHFPEKRIGYLGMMLLLTEETDVLMLATNALKNDLNNENKFVTGLALCAIGNLATADMSRDLVPEVEKHLKSSQPYLRKKACLAMARCLTKCPDMVEDFVERIITLLKDRSYGVLLASVQLIIEVLVADQKQRELERSADDESPTKIAFLRAVPSIVKLLRNVIGGGYSNENDISGVSDPFLQVQILTLLRLLGSGNLKASDEMNDVLAQVATSAESSNNSGNAILYECVQTILAIESEDSLRVMAINILGRFLLNKDNNIRYVALNTLSRCFVEQQVSSDDKKNSDKGTGSASSALLRHRATILECLKDSDISLRQRALELIYYLVNQENVKDMTAELLNYLVLCPREHRGDICTRILRVVEKFSPDDRWRVDTLITMLTIAGRECTRSVLSSIVVYISRSSEDIHAYAVHRLLKAVRDDDGSQKGLLLVGIWCIGEYGDLLLKPYSFGSYRDQSDILFSNGVQDTPIVSSFSFTASEALSIVATIEDIVLRPNCPEDVKQRALTSFTKLWSRFCNLGNPTVLSKLQTLTKLYATSNSTELQVRSCEYDALINTMNGISCKKKNENDFFAAVHENGLSETIKAAAKDAVARMPVVDLSVLQRKRSSLSAGADNGISKEGLTSFSETSQAKDLLDFGNIFQTSQAISTKSDIGIGSAVISDKSDSDLLADIFSSVPAPTPAKLQPSAPYDFFNPSGPVPSIAIASNTSYPPHLQAVSGTSKFDALGPAFIDAPLQSTALFDSSTKTQQTLPIIVPGFSHANLLVDFECSKPDLSNKQKSTVLMRFQNSSDVPFHGLSVQCAVPKYVTMEMKPPTSTTIPPISSISANLVTQIISVTNTMLGTKNLMLKLKVSFTANGAKVEHTVTCSSFPIGEF